MIEDVIHERSYGDTTIFIGRGYRGETGNIKLFERCEYMDFHSLYDFVYAISHETGSCSVIYIEDMS